MNSKLYENVRVIGFDLDGTLYDEFEFIKQVYQDIVFKTGCSDKKKEVVLEFMLDRWLEKGSSYPFIFKETQQKFCLSGGFEKEALNIYRDYFPVINLSARNHYILNKAKKDKKKLFLLTNGKTKLQKRKIEALGVKYYFDLIIIAEKYQKPDPYYGQEVLKNFACYPQEVVYIGDRDCDRQFAENCGFYYHSATQIY